MTRLTGAVLLLIGLCAPAAALDSSPPPQPQGGYQPGLGDLMTMTVQPRHIKLGLAGLAKNWPYAAFELHDLQEAFQRAGQVWPTWQNVPVGQMMQGITAAPFAALTAAINAKDSAKFTAAYKQLTDACDACHQAAGRPMVVIQVPAGSTFPDQNFAP